MAEENSVKEHISYSELKDYYFCPFLHKLKWIDKAMQFFGNEYTITGTAVHATCELMLNEEKEWGEGFIFSKEKYVEHYTQEFKKEMREFLADPEKSAGLNRQNTMKVYEQCLGLFDGILEKLHQEFGNYKLVECEHQLYQPIIGHDYNFKGFIDLILELEDGSRVIIDWKTASWGWDVSKKTSKEITYQLTLYKYFYCQEQSFDPSKIKTFFALLKRTAKKDKVELVPVTSGERKMNNAFDWLTSAVSNIKAKKHQHDRRNCVNCDSGNKCVFSQKTIRS